MRCRVRIGASCGSFPHVVENLLCARARNFARNQPNSEPTPFSVRWWALWHSAHQPKHATRMHILIQWYIGKFRIQLHAYVRDVCGCLCTHVHISWYHRLCEYIIRSTLSPHSVCTHTPHMSVFCANMIKVLPRHWAMHKTLQDM